MGGSETQGGANNAGAMGVYDPNYDYGGGGSFPSAIAKGFQQFGAGISGGGQTPNFMTPSNFAAPYIPSSESQMNPALIPTPAGGAQQDLLAAIQRLLSSGGLG